MTLWEVSLSVMNLQRLISGICSSPLLLALLSIVTSFSSLFSCPQLSCFDPFPHIMLCYYIMFTRKLLSLQFKPNQYDRCGTSLWPRSRRSNKKDVSVSVKLNQFLFGMVWTFRLITRRCGRLSSEPETDKTMQNKRPAVAHKERTIPNV